MPKQQVQSDVKARRLSLPAMRARISQAKVTVTVPDDWVTDGFFLIKSSELRSKLQGAFEQSQRSVCFDHNVWNNIIRAFELDARAAEPCDCPNTSLARTVHHWCKGPDVTCRASAGNTRYFWLNCGQLVGVLSER